MESERGAETVISGLQVCCLLSLCSLSAPKKLLLGKGEHPAGCPLQGGSLRGAQLVRDLAWGGGTPEVGWRRGGSGW